MRITMIGHSTVLVETAGKRILADPFFGTRGNLAYGRLGSPAKSREELRGVDAVLVSHDHWDHTDGKFFRMIGGTPVIAPKPTAWLIKLRGGRNVVGIEAGSSVDVGEVKIIGVPAAHVTVTRGYVLRAEEKCVYFAGDTYYRPFMKDIGREYRLDVALIPVTTYRIPMTMGEKQAVRAVQALKPAVVIPIHLGLLPRSPLLRTCQTPEGFARRLKESGATTTVVILHEGESYVV